MRKKEIFVFCFIIVSLLLSGCVSTQEIIKRPDITYTKQSNIYSHHPKYYDLQKTINQREYRLLPSYLQTFYKQNEEKNDFKSISR